MCCPSSSPQKLSFNDSGIATHHTKRPKCQLFFVELLIGNAVGVPYIFLGWPRTIKKMGMRCTGPPAKFELEKMCTKVMVFLKKSTAEASTGIIFPAIWAESKQISCCCMFCVFSLAWFWCFSYNPCFNVRANKNRGHNGDV